MNACPWKFGANTHDTIKYDMRPLRFMFNCGTELFTRQKVNLFCHSPPITRKTEFSFNVTLHISSLKDTSNHKNWLQWSSDDTRIQLDKVCRYATWPSASWKCPETPVSGFLVFVSPTVAAGLASYRHTLCFLLCSAQQLYELWRSIGNDNYCLYVKLNATASSYPDNDNTRHIVNRRRLATACWLTPEAQFGVQDENMTKFVSTNPSNRTFTRYVRLQRNVSV